MLLRDIPGHSDTKQFFTKMVQEDRVPHALMLVGGEGYGKLALALGLATYLQCPQKTAGGACGECNSCHKATQFIHPDIHFSFPVIKKDKLKREDTTSKHFLPEFRSFLDTKPYGDINEWLQHLGAVDKQPNMNVAECNQMIKNLGLKTYEGDYKVQIVWNADHLGKEGNRILKLVEEPSDDTIIIMITNNRGSILNTLQSRCQIVNVPPVSDEALLGYIKSQFELSEEDQQELAFLAAGNLRKAQLLGQRQELNYSEDLLNWLRISYKGDPEDIVAFMDSKAASGKQELVNFFEYGLHFLREYLLYLNTGHLDALRLTSTEKEVAHKMTKIISFGKTEQIKSLLEESIDFVRRNVGLKALVMTMSLQINTILKSEVNNFVS